MKSANETLQKELLVLTNKTLKINHSSMILVDALHSQ